jgi:TonB family protein
VPDPANPAARQQPRAAGVPAQDGPAAPAASRAKPKARAFEKAALPARPVPAAVARAAAPPDSGEQLEASGKPGPAEVSTPKAAKATRHAVEKLQASRAVAVAVAGGVPVLRGAAQLAVQALQRRDDVPTGGGLGEERGAASLLGAGRMQRLVQQRVDHVAELLGPSAVARAGKTGEALVDLRVDALGYVSDATLVRSAGDPRLDEELEAIIHLGEPYPRFEGAMRVRVFFAR